MRRFFGFVFAAGILLLPASRADAQVAVSVGYPAYGYAYSYPYVGYYGGPGVNVAVPGFSYSSGYYPVYAAPVRTYYPAAYYASSYYATAVGVSVSTPFFSYSGGYGPGIVVRVP